MSCSHATYVQYCITEILFLLQGRSLRVSYQQSLDSNPVPPPPKLKSDPSESSRQENDNILNSILPPR